MNILDRSSVKIRSGIPYFEVSEISGLEWVRHAFLTRRGGVSLPPYDSLNLGFRTGDDRLSQNGNLIGAAFGFNPENLVLLHQEHADRILVIEDSPDPLAYPLEYDAVITRAMKRVLAIQTADCIPLFVIDRRRKAIAAIHAGRQGTALGITRKVLRRMREEFGSSPVDLSVALGPSIGPCCYEIDKKAFIPEWDPFSLHKGGGRWMVDLAQINIAQMKEEGLQEGQISKIDLCTRCHGDLFFSYRREPETGRQLSFIGIV
ncbi:MAG: hypothetical protein A2162_04500 [Deltaproteobacteria bacterium RBG_13_52_11b]|nr:MAG: hypothetical protein A2162_04500 [Deltaproteobacteria bacterium RBG_13_52_11b]